MHRAVSLPGWALPLSLNFLLPISTRRVDSLWGSAALGRLEIRDRKKPHHDKTVAQVLGD